VASLLAGSAFAGLAWAGLVGSTSACSDPAGPDFAGAAAAVSGSSGSDAPARLAEASVADGPEEPDPAVAESGLAGVPAGPADASWLFPDACATTSRLNQLVASDAACGISGIFGNRIAGRVGCSAGRPGGLAGLWG